jgi:hypothetical protein
MAQSQAVSANDQQDVHAEVIANGADAARTDFYDLIGMMALELKQRRLQAQVNSEN